MRLAEIERLRNTTDRALLLFVTDRCPVGCAHCSVDSRPDSPSISDRPLFEDLVGAIAARPSHQLVGISGGEPFVERWGLAHAVGELSASGKDIVVYTSGVWAKRRVPEWIRGVLRTASAIVLSTDAFHAAAVDDDALVRAIDAVGEAGTHLIVQALDLPGTADRVRALLAEALGADWHSRAELNPIPPLPYGRGAAVFDHGPPQKGHEYGRCPSLHAPVIRYDGIVVACCNERVIMGAGPGGLRRRVSTGDELGMALDRLRDDPLLRTFREIGCGRLTEHPRFADLGEERFDSICSLCWEMHGRLGESNASDDQLLVAISHIAGGAS